MGRFGRLVAFVLSLAACFGAVGCTPSRGATNVRFVVSSLQIEEGARPVSGAVDAARSGVTDTLEGYANEVVLPSLRSGGQDADLRPFFTTAAAARVRSHPDRAAFVDEGLPPAATVKPTASYPSVALVALVGPDGQVGVVTARFRLALETTVLGEPLTLDRSGDLGLVRDGDAWRIDSYAVTVTRATPQDTTSTTATG